MPEPIRTGQAEHGSDYCTTTNEGFPVSRFVDGLFFVGALATVIYWISLTSDSWFFSDDWPLGHQAMSLRRILTPYNGHLSVIILAIYRALFEIFGFRTYLPWRILGATGIASVGVSVYLTSRRRIGTPLAILLGTVMLWPTGLTLEVAAINHYLALTAGIGCAYALNQTESRRNSLAILVLVTFSLASSGVGVPVALACLVFCACTRPCRHRVLAVLAPMAAWGIWWLTVAHTAGGVRATSVSQWIHSLLFNLKNTFVGLSFGSEIMAIPVAFLVLARLVQLTRRSLDEAANALAWLGALGVWLAGIAWTRPMAGETAYFRYTFVAMGFVVLALLPRRPLAVPAITTVSAARNWQATSVGIVALSTGIVIFTGIGSVRTGAQELNDFGAETRSVAAVVNLGPTAVPDNLRLSVNFYKGSVGQVRQVLDFYGGFTVTPEAEDKAVATLVQPVSVPPGNAASRCPSTTFPTRFSDGGLVLTSGAKPAVVLAKFKGTRWFQVTSIGAHQSVRLVIPSQFGDLMTWSTKPPGAPIRAGSVGTGGVTCIDGSP